MPSSTRLVARLAWRNVHRRPGQALLLFMALILATSCLSLALAVRETHDSAAVRLSEATNGFHVYAKLFDHNPRSEAMLAVLADAPEVAAAGGPWTGLVVDGEVGGAQVELRVQLRDPAAVSAVDQPAMTSGRWHGAGTGAGVVLEDGLAATLQVEPGDTVTLAGRPLPVLGTAMTLSTQRYPQEQPALVWADQANAADLRAPGRGDPGSGDPGPVGEFRWIALRLHDPGQAEAFVRQVAASLPADTRETWELHSWQERRAEESQGSPIRALAVALLAAGTLLAGLTVATAALLVAGRMAGQLRQVGTLKAVGVTPAQVTWVLLVEYVSLAMVATVVGVLVGTALSPVLAQSVVTLYGGPQAPPIIAATVLLALAAVNAVVTATFAARDNARNHAIIRSSAPPRPRPRPRSWSRSSPAACSRS